MTTFQESVVDDVMTQSIPAGVLAEFKTAPVLLSTKAAVDQSQEYFYAFVMAFDVEDEPKASLTEEDYPVLARIWNNQDDDIFDSM